MTLDFTRPLPRYGALALGLLLLWAVFARQSDFSYSVQPGILFWMYPGLEKEAISSCLEKMAEQVQQAKSADAGGSFPQDFNVPKCAARDMRKYKVWYWRGGEAQSYQFLLLAYRGYGDYYFYTSAEPEFIADFFTPPLKAAGLDPANLKFDPTVPDTNYGFYFGDYSQASHQALHPDAPAPE